VLSAGVAIGPYATLGNRAFGEESMAYAHGVFNGAPAELLYKLSASPSGLPPAASDIKCVAALAVWSLSLVVSQSFTLVMSVPAILLFRLSRWFLIPYIICNPIGQMVWTIAITLLVKRALIGRFDEGKPDFTSSWRGLMRTVVMFHLGAVGESCEVFKGTLVWNSIQRLFGAKIGRDTCWLGNIVPEPEMLTIGDATIIGPGVDFFTHNAENMHFNYEPIIIGHGCVVHEQAALMGHSRVHSGAQLLPLAQGMKAMHFTHNKMYAGNPADLVQEASEASAPAGSASGVCGVV